MAFALRPVRRCALPTGFALSLLALSISAAHADVTDLGSVGTQAESGTAASAGVAPSQAAAAAPTSASLSATQPQSAIQRTFIEDAKSPVSDYTAVAAIAPSVAGGVTPNGPGLGETKNTIRGFQDGQYNITFDGIPFGDTNGPTHHSTSYFPAQVIGSVMVERGPGTASNIGQATFGGSLNLFSRELSKDEEITPYYSRGSWDTQLKGLRYETGTLANHGDARASVSYQQLTSDGYRTYSGLEAQNLAVKMEKPIGDSTLLTVDLNHNSNWFYAPDKDNGLTRAQSLALGKNYVLSGDPTKANYFGYNRVDKSTDFDYVRLQSDLGSGWAVDNTLYYYNYVNDTFTASSASTPGAGAQPTKVFNASGAQVAGGIPGYEKVNKYWVSGDVFKATRHLEPGLLRVGAWLEHAETFRTTLDMNVVNGATNYDQNAVPGLITGKNGFKYDQNSSWNNYQPFAEFEWKVTDNLKVTPGFKYVDTALKLDASINQTARIPQNVDKTFNARLPYLTANYRITDQWSTYAQYAQGMVVPDISSFQSKNADASDIKPQMTTNYQLGVVHKAERLLFDADVYRIKFNNMIAVLPGSDPAQPVYYNAGGANYKGVEGQLTYALVKGLSVFANGSANHATSKDSGLQIANAPVSTSALGSIYKLEGWDLAYVYKHVGNQYVLPDATYLMNGYNTTDLTLGYSFNPGHAVGKVKLQFGIYNLQNRQTILSVNPTNTTAGSAGYGLANVKDTYLFQPARSYMGSIIITI